MTPAIPLEVTGLWRRQAMIHPDGRRDTTTQVLWLQTRHLFADLRVPADRPSVPGATGFADYDAESLPRLARMQGFAGTLEVTGDICRWHRELDFQPPGGPPDEAKFRIEGETLVETGIHAAYEEIWERQTPPGADLASFRLLPAKPGPRGVLVLAGDHFIAVEERRPKLPEAASLASLLARDPDRRRASDLLGLLIAAGRLGPAGGTGWQIELATFPWLEGRTLAPGGSRFDPVKGRLHMETAEGLRHWQLVEASCSLDRLGVILGT
jgi:hypothetical protein